MRNDWALGCSKRTTTNQWCAKRPSFASSSCMWCWAKSGFGHSSPRWTRAKSGGFQIAKCVRVLSILIDSLLCRLLNVYISKSQNKSYSWSKNAKWLWLARGRKFAKKFRKLSKMIGAIPEEKANTTWEYGESMCTHNTMTYITYISVVVAMRESWCGRFVGGKMYGLIDV